MKTIEWKLMKKEELSQTIQYFKTKQIEEEPTFDFPQNIETTVKEILERGNIIIVKNNENIVGLLAYTIGTPRIENNKLKCEPDNIFHVYAWVIDKEYRGKTSLEGIKAIRNQAKKKNCTKVQFRAEKENTILNKFYLRYAPIVKEELSTIGVASNTYKIQI